MSATCLNFDRKCRKLDADVRELVESQVGNQVCHQIRDLDSVMEFGLYLSDCAVKNSFVPSTQEVGESDKFSYTDTSAPVT